MDSFWPGSHLVLDLANLLSDHVRHCENMGAPGAPRAPSMRVQYMSYNLNSLKGDYTGIVQGTTIGVIKGDTRSLDYSSYVQPLVSSLLHVHGPGCRFC